MLRSLATKASLVMRLQPPLAGTSTSMMINQLEITVNRIFLLFPAPHIPLDPALLNRIISNTTTPEDDQLFISNKPPPLFVLGAAKCTYVRVPSQFPVMIVFDR